jgi:outer membrane biosynthesis protein TonB
MKVVLGTLKDKGELLTTFLEPRVGVKPTMSGDTMEINDESVREGVKPRHVKTYIKRFLFMNGIRKNYRVFVAGKELTIQEIELEEEEEEEEKPKKEAEAPAEEAKPEEAEEEKPAEPAPEKEPKVAKPKKAAAKKPKAKKKADED